MKKFSIKIGLVGIIAMFVVTSFSFSVQAAETKLAKQGTYSITFPWHFKGQSYQVGENHFFGRGLAWGPALSDAGEGFLHDTSVLSMYTLDIKNGAAKLSGYLVVTDSNGDKAFMVWEGMQPEGAEWAEGTFNWNGGTGKYQGLMGQAKWRHKAVSVRTSGADVEGEGFSIWKGDYKLP